MTASKGFVLADDATGALECASLLADMHLQVSLSLSAVPGEFDGICVVNTESRHVPPTEAARRIRQWLSPFRTLKKTDSTLRGNIAAELMALLDRPVVYIPAYPALGRTVQDGTLFVHGTPVAETDFGNDARVPVRSSFVSDLFPPGTSEPIAGAAALSLALGNPQPRILICDAATTGELAEYAGVLQNAQVHIASPAGFIPFWARLAEFPKRTPPPFPRPKNWLIVCGSRHPLSRRQARQAANCGMTVVLSSEETQSHPDTVAASLAADAVRLIVTQRPDAVLIMGGDTVQALWRALGITALRPLPELLPGIAACLSEERQLLFVTKAGGFGDDSLVERILERCTQL